MLIKSLEIVKSKSIASPTGFYRKYKIHYFDYFKQKSYVNPVYYQIQLIFFLSLMVYTFKSSN